MPVVSVGLVGLAALAACAHAPPGVARPIPSPVPRVVVEAPAPGQLVRGAEVDVRGRFVTYDGRAWIFADGTRAEIAGDRFVAHHVPLREGPVSIVLALSDGRGANAHASVEVVVEPPERPRSATLCQGHLGCVRYEQRGVPRRDAAGKIVNAVVILVAYGLDERLDEMWPDVVGPGRALDPRDRVVIGVTGIAGERTGAAPASPAGTAALLPALFDALELDRGAAVIGVSTYGAEAALRALADGAFAGSLLVCGGHDRPYDEPALRAVGEAAARTTGAGPELARALAAIVPAGDVPGLAAHLRAHPAAELAARLAPTLALASAPLAYPPLAGRRVQVVANQDDKLASIIRVRALALRLRLAGAAVVVHELADPLGHEAFFARVPPALEAAIAALLAPTPSPGR